MVNLKNTKNLIGYILPNGEIFNLLEQKFNTHWHYEQYLIKEGKLNAMLNKYEHQLTNLNQWVRINDGTNFYFEVLAELPIKGLTEEQYKSLEEFLNYLREKNRPFIEIGIEEHSVGIHFTDKSLWYSRFEFDKFTNQEILFFIRDAYRTFDTYK